MKSIRVFSEIRIKDIPSVGGKNASLGEMFSQLSSKGIRVPDGFAITAEGYWQFLNYNKLVPELDKILSQLDVKTFNNLSAVGSVARSLILEAAFPEELKTEILEASIRLYDKLMVILSQHSIDSSWVEYEVNKALKKEQDQGKPALFPIALDEAIKDAPDAWAADIRRKRHIGDFTRWKDHDAYQVAFGRLLRDLQASTIPPMRQS